MKKHIMVSILFLATALTIQSCKKKDKEPDKKESFDEGEMLTNLSSNLIIPTYKLLQEDVSKMSDDINNFTQNPSSTTLATARTSWYNALTTWQKAAVFGIGPASDIALRDNVNIHPVDTTLIHQNIALGSYNLASIANYAAKGFQAIDYLFYGIASTEEQLITTYSTGENAANTKKYLTDVTDDILAKVTQVNSAWESYAAEFNKNTGTNVGSSIGLLTNELNLYYERAVRDGKVGIPAGARTFSQTPLPEKSEIYYSKGNSRDLLIQSIKSLKKLYMGESLNGSSGSGYDDYLNHVDAVFNDQSLDKTIQNQFDLIEQKSTSINENISKEVVDNQPKMLELFNDMQFLNSLLKVEMTNSLEVQINYADTDGD